MQKRIFTIIFFILFSLCIVPVSFAQSGVEEKTEVVVFVRAGCTHCQAEEAFFKKIEPQKNIRVQLRNVADEKASEQFSAFTTRANIPKVTPITIIGTSYIIGFDSEKTTGETILKLIEETAKNSTPTDLENATLYGEKSSTCDESGSVPCEVQKPGLTVTLPFFGSINSAKYPLIAISSILGFIDGFNPCAMWVLVTFLLLLLQAGSRKKMAVYAGIFILAEAIMYTLILTVWYKTWNFVKLDSIITPFIGVVTIIGGGFFLREWRKKELECHVSGVVQRSKTVAKLKQLTAEKFSLYTCLGILVVAFSVNIIEFACSIGIPQSFTKILELNHLLGIQYMLYIFIYILFYMIDDFVVFGLALYGAEKLSLTTKYSKISNLIGGILMLLLGTIMIVKPGLILF